HADLRPACDLAPRPADVRSERDPDRGDGGEPAPRTPARRDGGDPHVLRVARAGIRGRAIPAVGNPRRRGPRRARRHHRWLVFRGAGEPPEPFQRPEITLTWSRYPTRTCHRS